MIAAHCFLHEFTDLGWRELAEDGSTDGPRKPGFVWHTDPGCVLLPGAARICFLRCDDAECMLGQARAPAQTTPWALVVLRVRVSLGF